MASFVWNWYFVSPMKPEGKMVDSFDVRPFRASAAHLVRRAAGVPQVRRHKSSAAAPMRPAPNPGTCRWPPSEMPPCALEQYSSMASMISPPFLQPGDLGHGVKVEVGAAVLVGLERRLARDGGAVGQRDVHGAEQLRVIRAVVVRTQGEGLVTWPFRCRSTRSPRCRHSRRQTLPTRAKADRPS